MSEPLVEWLHQGKTFIGTPQQLVDEVLYSNYRHNRESYPAMLPEKLEIVFGGKWVQLERRYQQELVRRLDGRTESLDPIS